MTELTTLREATVDLIEKVNAFYAIIVHDTPDWPEGADRIWDVEDATKAVIQAGWAYDKAELND